MTKPQPYPEYKDAGVPWLEDVPKSWPVVSTRVALRPMKVLAGTDPSKHQLLSLTKQGVIPRDMENAQGKHPENYDTYQVVDIDDLIFCLFDIDETPRTVGLVKEPGMLTGAYTRFKTTSAADPRFICWYFLALDNDKRLKPLYTGLRKVIQKTRFLSAPLPLPELKVQRAIADFLDRETAQIDDLLGKQERLIELLAEKRQAIITHAVTKGLDPTVPTKPTGQPYLGEIPGHWIVRPFRLAAEYQEGPGIMAEDFLEEGVPLLRISGVKDRYASLQGCKYLDPVKAATRWSHFRLRLEDVLISASASMGTVSEVGPETVGSIAYTGIIRLRPRAGATKEFLKLLVVSDAFLRQIELHKTGSTMQHYGPSHLSQMRFAFPPTSEQHQIVEHVNEACCKIDKLLEKAHASIDLLKERRSAVISAAVTGKIDVQEGAA